MERINSKYCLIIYTSVGIQNVAHFNVGTTLFRTNLKANKKGTHKVKLIFSRCETNLILLRCSTERKRTWRKLLNATKARQTTPQHAHHSAASTDTELTTIDTHELWIQESEPTPCTMSALGQFGAEMLKLSRGLEAASTHAIIKNNSHAGRSKLR